MSGGKVTPAQAVSTIAATIIGAGVLALPIAIASLGFIPGFLVLTVVGLAFLYTAYYIAEATIAADENVSLSGLAEKHYGKPGMVVMMIGVLIYIYGALIGYLSAGGQVLYDITGGFIPQWLGTLAYFSGASLVIYAGMKALAKGEHVLFVLLLVSFAALNLLVVRHLSVSFLLRADTSKLLPVFGVVFFAYNGHSIIPSLANQYKGNFRDFKKIAFLGLFFPYCLYVIWCLVVTGTVPYEGAAAAADRLSTASLMDAKAFSQPATIPLGHLYGGIIIALGSAFSVFATFTSFLGFGYSLAENFMDIFKRKLPWIVAVALAVVPPLVFNFANRDLFLKALDIAGTYGAGLFAGIMPCLIILKVRREKLRRPLVLKEKAGPYVILALFLVALTYTTVSFFR